MISHEDLHDARPAAPNGTAVLLLAGSSGRIERSRADLLASSGAHVRAIRWFGGVGQRPAAHEVPIELFTEQIEILRRDADRVVLFGTSFGAEAVLTTASVHNVDGVIAAAPSSVVWGGTDGSAWSSHWTLGGEPLSYVPFSRDWAPDTDPPAFVSLYESSFRQAAAFSSTARIRVELIVADLLLIAGGDDEVWPSQLFASEIERVRAQHGLATTVVSHPDAGHRLLLPGEDLVTGGVNMRRGGSLAADAELGKRAWPEIQRMLGS